MSSKNTIYKIKINKWFEKNDKHKKSYKKTLIENSLIHDAVINAMPLSHRWLWIGLLLICGEHNNDTITLTHRQLNDILTTKEGVQNALDRLESFQLLAYEKIDPFINRKEKKRKEEKRIEENIKEQKNEPQADTVLKIPEGPTFLEIASERVKKIYSEQYPLKKGKTKGVESLLRQLKSESDLQAFETAVNRYAQDCIKNRTESKYIKHFSSFANCWRDWLDPDAGQSRQPVALSRAERTQSNLQAVWEEILLEESVK